MAGYVTQPNISLAWLAALDLLLDRGGKGINVVVAIERAGEEDSRIRQLLDAFLSSHCEQGAVPVATVAGTLFPQVLYHPHLGPTAQQHLYAMYRRGYPKTRQHPANRAGTYFHRLIDWPGRHGVVNQLERAIERLRRERASARPKSSIYELALGVDEDLAPSDPIVGDDGIDLPIFRPDTDNRIMGFPCLSHISLTLHGGQLHVTALYRNQHFVRKAYGNYLGLSRLLQFLCTESGCEPGELVCVASHADAEVDRFGKRALATLVQQCQTCVTEDELVWLPR